jgi:quaternary ammonium compound-resistance protein SugE
MEWVYLVTAGFFEVGWAMGLKYSQGFTKILPSVITVAGMVASFYFLSLSLKSLPLGNAYAIWTGIGTVGTVVLGIILFKEPINVMRMICIALIVIGIVGLKMISAD